eukprot:CAMPEP_0174866368 /NCGR_PEP_ID=MMETSP1114-20130205/61968_1 /TAXON_ID=312471 /ORGANISM="Neobodo designis, Strain CCAP 1951/1" /LENGTH=38 /DNA_ID= /DNA_START= /DNA_END= /DNA_ORIENTATION=
MDEKKTLSQVTGVGWPPHSPRAPWRRMHARGGAAAAAA